MAKLVDASVIFITARIFAKVVPINVKYWKPIPIRCESSNLSLLLKNYFNKYLFLIGIYFLYNVSYYC